MSEGGDAVVLSGGGAYGAYEVGVMKALTCGASPATGYTRCDPAVVTGTSVGGINAALFVSSPDGRATAAADYLEDVWCTRIVGPEDSCTSTAFRMRGDINRLIDVRCAARDPAALVADVAGDTALISGQFVERARNFFESSAPLLNRLVELLDLETFIAPDPLVSLIESTIALSRIRASPRALRVVTANWRTGTLRIFRNEEMTDAMGHRPVLASAAIPGMFPSVEIEGDPYVDGGLVMNTPLKPAIAEGVSTIHVIYMDPDVQTIPLPRLRNLVNTFYRMMVISFGTAMNRDLRIADRINRGLSVQTGGRARRPAPPDPLIEGSKDPGEYRKLTVHRYHPAGQIGGIFRFLDFTPAQVSMLMERGWEDARTHDCRANRCILPS